MTRQSSEHFSESVFWKHLGWILLLKIALLTCLWYAFFGPSHEIVPDANMLLQHLTGHP